jgi:hypothetical protein
MLQFDSSEWCSRSCLPIPGPRRTADIAVAATNNCDAVLQPIGSLRDPTTEYARRVYGELVLHLWDRAAGSARPGALEGSPGGWVRSSDPPGQGLGVRQAQRQARPRPCREGLTDAGYHGSASRERRLRAACDDFQYLAADRAAARPDHMPVRGEGPPGLRVRRENAGLGAQQSSCRDRF